MSLLILIFWNKLIVTRNDSRSPRSKTNVIVAGPWRQVPIEPTEMKQKSKQNAPIYYVCGTVIFIPFVSTIIISAHVVCLFKNCLQINQDVMQVP